MDFDIRPFILGGIIFFFISAFLYLIYNWAFNRDNFRKYIYVSGFLFTVSLVLFISLLFLPITVLPELKISMNDDKRGQSGYLPSDRSGPARSVRSGPARSVRSIYDPSVRSEPAQSVQYQNLQSESDKSVSELRPSTYNSNKFQYRKTEKIPFCVKRSYEQIDPREPITNLTFNRKKIEELIIKTIEEDTGSDISGGSD